MAQSVSECVRGFSFMPENKVDVIDLQYIEGGELSRAWKMSRRERLKTIEARIWDEFINEGDIVKTVSTDDPYQFLEHLPEDCMRELMDTELHKMKKETSAEVVMEQPRQELNESLERPETMVTFAGDCNDHCDYITILDDEDGSEMGDREEHESVIESPCTVRENPSEPELAPNAEKGEKSPENVSSMIETSIYSAKVKELQSKVNLELLAVISTLQVVNLSSLEPQVIPKLQKQCGEFCARHCRVYLYPISRQIHDIVRHNNTVLPYARHTHTRSQMIRTVSLHQNMLQCLQVFHKWFTQKPPLKECVSSLKNFTQLVSQADAACPAEVHNEELLQSCDSLNEALDLYLGKIKNFVKNENCTNASVSRSGRSTRTLKKRSVGKGSTQGLNPKQDSEARLSMYSLDKFHFNSKCSIGRSSGGTSKARMGEAPSNVVKTENDSAANKKTTRSRRPLMRAPGFVQRREKPREPDNITTLVEGVHMTATPRASVANTSRLTPRSPTKLHRTPRDARKSKETTPRLSPKRAKNRSPELKLELAASQDSLPSVIKVQCAKKDSPIVKTARDNGDKSPKDKKEDKEVESSSDVSSLLRFLCAGQAAGGSRSQKERASGSKNAQLLCVNGDSPRQASFGTPQLLRILEETIQKQSPKPHFNTKPPQKDVDRFRLSLNTSSKTTEGLFQYRTKFVQHMLTSPLYANSAVGKPWEMIGQISEKIIDDILLSCAREMQLEEVVEELYKSETQ